MDNQVHVVKVSENEIRLFNRQDPERYVSFTLSEWVAFVAGVHNKEFDI